MNHPNLIYVDVEPDNEVIEKLVGKYYTLIKCKNYKVLYVNEEAEFLNLPLNKKASELADFNIYGNVIVLSPQIILEEIPLHL